MTNNKPLIIRLPNWIGDAIMALPTIYALKNLGIRLILLAKPAIASLLAALNIEIIVIHHRFWQDRKILSIYRGHYVLLLTNSLSSALVARLAFTKPIGYQTDGRRLLLDFKIKPLASLHQVEAYWRLAKFAVMNAFNINDWPATLPNKINLPIDIVVQKKINQLLKNRGIGQSFGVLCPFAHGINQQGEAKIWPHWQTLAARLAPIPLVICPNAAEEGLSNELFPQAIILKNLTLMEYAAVLSQSQWVIGNDTGPLHMASAVNPNTIGIFGVTDPSLTGPWKSRTVGKLGRWPDIETVLTQIHLID